MENKTLNTIQKLSKIGKIISKIISVCCLVGAIGCLVGIIALSTAGFDTIKIGGVTIHGIIEENAEMTIGTMYAGMIVAMILCCAEHIIAKMASKYFKNELIAGTPFTFEGAKELLRLGIITISVSIGSLIAADIAYKILNVYMTDIADMHLDDNQQIGFGIAFIIVSLLCKYGAEREADSVKKIESGE